MPGSSVTRPCRLCLQRERRLAAEVSAAVGWPAVAARSFIVLTFASMDSLPDVDLRPEYRSRPRHRRRRSRGCWNGSKTLRGRGRSIAILASSLRRALAHDRDMVGQQHRFGNIVGDEQDGRAGVARQHLQVVLHHHPGLRVERAERLVHQDHVGAIHQRAGDRAALLHAAGQLAGKILLEAGEADRPRAPRRRAARRSAAATPRSSSGSSTFSASVFHGNSCACCGTKPTSRLTALMVWPRWRTTPRVGASNPAAICSSVLLPQPLGPITATNFPLSDLEADAVDHADAAICSRCRESPAGCRRTRALHHSCRPRPAGYHV